jgi:transcription initiation factor TFIIH subunit 1
MAMPANSTTYPQVRLKQTEGTVILSVDKLTFQPNDSNGSGGPIHIPWPQVLKHQVSPATHSKALLKLNLTENKSTTFRLTNRSELERIRKDVTRRLHKFKQQQQSSAPTNGSSTTTVATTTSATISANSKKRSHAALTAAEFGDMDPTSMAVTRSSLLAANAILRAQHHYLVTETETVTEDDFWQTHQSLVEEEYAKICGTTKTGPSSLLQSHLVTAQDNKITLGVEEMRQIFIMYPAVHKAYEEKVPLELSDEQFWRKYLESEFFHRDRGKLGTAARNHASESKKKNSSSLTAEQQDARAAAVGTDDLFARYDQKLRESNTPTSSSTIDTSKKKWGTHLAVGQFDLASTFETERGRLLQGPRDIHPPNAEDNGKGARVVRKYNRHWAMVLHPDEAVAGSDLMTVARKSVHQVLKDDDDPKASGGVSKEMRRLVNFANAEEQDANHVTGTGLDDEDYESLNLSNIEAYSFHDKLTKNTTEADQATIDRCRAFSSFMAQRMKQFAQVSKAGNIVSAEDCCPESKWGRSLLGALTKRMADDAKTDEDRNEAVNRLDEQFKKKLDTYFRRSSELLRHFFGIRRLEAQGGGKNETKLSRIVQGLEAVYREMETVRKDLPQNEEGEMMRKMCLPIMDQLDCAFKLHRETASGAGGGGFVDV